MNELLLVVPSRGRPGNIARLWEAMQTTCQGETLLLVGLDADDPTINDYPHGPIYEIRTGLRGVVAWMNELAMPRAGRYHAIGHIGDDNVPRTVGWDTQLMAALEKTPFAFANDLYPRAPGSLCCHIFCRAEIVSALGYLGPPAISHMYVDAAWMAWGEAIGITYLHDVILEHMHYTVGKSAEDDTYRSSRALDPRDLVAFNAYCADPDGLNADIAKIAAVTGSGGPFTDQALAEFKNDLNIAPSGLQLDLLTAVVRLEQIRDELAAGRDCFAMDLLESRVIGCDLPRLRTYLTPETLAWSAETDP